MFMLTECSTMVDLKVTSHGTKESMAQIYNSSAHTIHAKTRLQWKDAVNLASLLSFELHDRSPLVHETTNFHANLKLEIISGCGCILFVYLHFIFI